MIFVVSPPTESTKFPKFSPAVLIFALYMVTKPSKFSWPWEFPQPKEKFSLGPQPKENFSLGSDLWEFFST